eukprot:5285260-Pyramimonas_sp.AAC.1
MARADRPLRRQRAGASAVASRPRRGGWVSWAGPPQRGQGGARQGLPLLARSAGAVCGFAISALPW